MKPLTMQFNNSAAVVLGLFTQPILLDLAGRAERDAVDEHDIARRPPLGDLAFEELDQLFTRHLGIGLLGHHQQRALVPLQVPGGDAGGHSDRG